MMWKWFLFRDGEIEMSDRKVRHEDVVDDLLVIAQQHDQRVLFKGEDLIVIDRGEPNAIAFYVKVS